MICHYRNGISCGENTMEFEDQSAIRGKLNSNRIRPSWSHILGILGKGKNVERERRRRIRRRRRERKKRKVWIVGFVWIVWITMGLYGFFDFCMDISLFHF